MFTITRRKPDAFDIAGTPIVIAIFCFDLILCILDVGASLVLLPLIFLATFFDIFIYPVENRIYRNSYKVDSPALIVNPGVPVIGAVGISALCRMFPNVSKFFLYGHTGFFTGIANGLTNLVISIGLFFTNVAETVLTSFDGLISLADKNLPSVPVIGKLAWLWSPLSWCLHKLAGLFLMFHEKNGGIIQHGGAFLMESTTSSEMIAAITIILFIVYALIAVAKTIENGNVKEAGYDILRIPIIRVIWVQFGRCVALLLSSLPIFSFFFDVNFDESKFENTGEYFDPEEA